MPIFIGRGAAVRFGPRKLYANLGRAACQDDGGAFAVM
jgi:hypothetical protein